MEECKNYGKVISIKIPRPDLDGAAVSGIGKVFVEFATRDGANFAREVRLQKLNLEFKRKIISWKICSGGVSSRGYV